MIIKVAIVIILKYIIEYLKRSLHEKKVKLIEGITYQTKYGKLTYLGKINHINFNGDVPLETRN